MLRTVSRRSGHPLICPLVCRFVDELKHMGESSCTSEIWIGNIFFINEPLNFVKPVFTISRQCCHIPEIALVHDKDQVKVVEVFLDDLPGSLFADVHVVSSHFLLGPAIWSFPVVKAIGSGRVNFDSQAFGLDVVAQQSFCHGRAADVS